jgi:hypothetical protein
MDSERNEHSNCRNSYRRRQVDCPTFPQEQPDARDDLCKARDKIEPKNERNDVAGSTSCFQSPNRVFPPTTMVAAPNAIATSARTAALRGVRGVIGYMTCAFATARCCQSCSWQRPIQHDMANLAASCLTSIKQQIGPSAQNALYVSRTWENGRAPTRMGHRPCPAAVLQRERGEFQ